MMNLSEVADELTRRVISLFEKDEKGNRGFITTNMAGFITSLEMRTWYYSMNTFTVTQERVWVRVTKRDGQHSLLN
jgi:hypothetical protein